ncbi:MAG: TonB family protein [Bacteroidetes bacterium]|nr:MAG: TonB family protein [Bacteroidota bacterium]
MNTRLLFCISLMWALSFSAAFAQEEEPDINAFIYVDQEALPLNIAEIRSSITYPERAVKDNAEGTMIVRILVDKTGTYVRHRVIKEVHPSLTVAVEQQIANLKFRPAVANNKAVMHWVNIPFAFKLVDQKESQVRANIAELNEKLKTDSLSYELYHKRGIQETEIRQYEKALADFNKSLALNPRKNKKKDKGPYEYLFYAYYGRASAYSGMNKIKEALADYTAALETATTMKAVDSAVQATLPSVYLERGYLYALDSAYAPAIADLNKALQLSPEKKCEIYEYLAEIAVAQDNPSSLVENYSQLIVCRPKDYLLRYSLGFYKGRSGDYAGAVQELKIAADSTGNKALKLAAINRSAWSYLQLKQYAEALSEIDKALKINALTPLSYYYRGLVFHAQGKTDEACKEVRKSLSFGIEGDERGEAVAFMKEHCGGWEE